MKKYYKTLLATTIAFSLTACQGTMGTKEGFGTVAGGVVGGLLGSQIGGGTGKKIATLLGVGVGAWLGNRIGASLDKADQEALARTTRDTINKGRDGETNTWSNPKTGASAKVTARNSRTKTQTITMKRPKNISAPPKMELMGDIYQAVKRSNVRAAPTTGSDVVHKLNPGDKIKAVGKVQNQPWILIASNERTIGYIYAPLIKKVDEAALDMGDVQMANVREDAINLDDVELVEETVAVQTQCRTVDYSVTNKSGETEQSTYDTCKGSDGAWEII